MVKEYKIIEEKTINKIKEDLDAHADQNWVVILSVQEYGYTKLLLERDKGVKNV